MKLDLIDYCEKAKDIAKSYYKDQNINEQQFDYYIACLLDDLSLHVEHIVEHRRGATIQLAAALIAASPVHR